MSFHVDRIAKHASLLQTSSHRASAYAHNFAAAKAAIKTALDALSDQLQTGHNHDKAELARAWTTADNAIIAAETHGQNVVTGFKKKACPTKRKMIEAENHKKAAKQEMVKIQDTKMCSTGIVETWKDMDVDKSNYKLGTQLRNQWEKAKSDWRKAKTKYDLAVIAHTQAVAAHGVAMSGFRAAVTSEAVIANTGCKNAHTQYKNLNDEVQANVHTRKQVFRGVEAITCYVTHLTDNDAAKSCADDAFKKDTSNWDIPAKTLPTCKSTTTLENSFGPMTWTPTTTNCHF